MKDKEFQCAVCDGVFTKSWSDEEAMQEFIAQFGGEYPGGDDALVVVCESCSKKMDAWLEEKNREKKKN